MNKVKWCVEIDQNGGEYTGWVTFYAKNVTKTGECTLNVDGSEMEFDEKIELSCEYEDDKQGD